MLEKIMMYKKGGLYGKKNNFCVVNCWDLPICDCLFPGFPVSPASLRGFALAEFWNKCL